MSYVGMFKFFFPVSIMLIILHETTNNMDNLPLTYGELLYFLASSYTCLQHLDLVGATSVVVHQSLKRLVHHILF